MLRALFTSATGMRAQETNIDVVSNNLANVNTTGFKRGRAEFEDLVYQYVIEPGTSTSENTLHPSGIQVGLGVRPSSVQKIFTQGDLISTGNQFDVAIEGDGFFQVELPDGTTAYSRAGNFQLDQDGKLVTADGYPITPEVTLPANTTSVTIGADGTVSARVAGQTATSTVANLEGARFANNAGLKAIGKNLFQETDSSGTATTGAFGVDGIGSLQQGFLESSNVSIVEQVVSMITGQRAYEASSRGIQAADEMLSQAINLRR